MQLRWWENDRKVSRLRCSVPITNMKPMAPSFPLRAKLSCLLTPIWHFHTGFSVCLEFYGWKKDRNVEVSAFGLQKRLKERDKRGIEKCKCVKWEKTLNILIWLFKKFQEFAHTNLKASNSCFEPFQSFQSEPGTRIINLMNWKHFYLSCVSAFNRAGKLLCSNRKAGACCIKTSPFVI